MPYLKSITELPYNEFYDNFLRKGALMVEKNPYINDNEIYVTLPDHISFELLEWIVDNKPDCITHYGKTKENKQIICLFWKREEDK